MTPLFDLITLKNSRRTLEKKIEVFLQKNGIQTLSYSEFLLLFYIKNNPGLNQLALSKVAYVSPAMINKMTKNLKYYDLIIDKKTRNASSLFLSLKGKRLISNAHCWVDYFLNKNSRDNIISLHNLIKCINETLINSF
ncbi:hypothetical protein PM10SUCC1_29000 [Propionigenium maris DSM 9537]|uniref:DNA-binding transcriptional regulator, MarR family n=1 Tax=Propionigenium maris DSM 9537 TaxID=1123000 RepID=A0A9W6GP52_9FUSO|nr:hypothetical protein PM10SUCC1_29000 [Propionigenium maris DSM 9537]